jgi:hypothetical protein
MQKVLDFTTKALGVGLVVGLSLVGFSNRATAFSFSSDRANCFSGGGCFSAVNGTDYAFEGGAPSFGTRILTGNNLAVGITPNVAAAPLGDETQYLVVGKGIGQNPIPDSLTVNFAETNLRYFGAYWGSMDRSNVLTFYSGVNGTGTLLGAINGNDVTFPLGEADGDQNIDIDNRYVNVFFGPGERYRSVVISTNQVAFELDNVTTAIPEPTTMVGLAVAAGAGVVLKRRQKQQQGA